MTLIAVIDYDMGNLHSACKGLETVGAVPKITDSPLDLEKADAIVLPGVGSFDPAVRQIRSRHLEKPIKAAIANGKPFLGICLGLQILFDSSEEGQEAGLGVIPGTVRRFRSEPGITIPHMGWNQVQQVQKHALWEGIPDNSAFYFVHSYYAVPANSAHTVGATDYGSLFTCAVAKDNIFATQFHPEKSAHLGLRLYQNFTRWQP